MSLYLTPVLPHRGSRSQNGPTATLGFSPNGPTPMAGLSDARNSPVERFAAQAALFAA